MMTGREFVRPFQSARGLRPLRHRKLGCYPIHVDGLWRHRRFHIIVKLICLLEHGVLVVGPPVGIYANRQSINRHSVLMHMALHQQGHSGRQN